MSRPNIFCHIHMSLDGKILGPYLKTDTAKASMIEYYKLVLGKNHFFKNHKGWLSGRITTEDNFTHYREPELDVDAETVPEGDFIAVKDADMHYFSIDPSGRLGWETNQITYFETTAHVVQIITGKVNNAYKDFLRRKNISYIIAGEDSLDLEKAVLKIQEYFNVDEIMLGGGGGINWSFLQAGLVDEISIVMTPAADGSTDTQTLFDANEKYNQPTPMTFKIKQTEILDDGSVWLRYLVNNDE